MMKILINMTAALIFCSTPAYTQQLWCWSFGGPGVSAAGTFLTESDADADGYYRITAITGTANSATITALQPTGTSVPGNEGFPVDNLVRTTAPLLSKHGFGFMASNGTYHNPFHMDKYRDYVSRPPYANGKGTEPSIQFKAITAPDSHCPAR
jgi:hypothetical protein